MKIPLFKTTPLPHNKNQPALFFSPAGPLSYSIPRSIPRSSNFRQSGSIAASWSK